MNPQDNSCPRCIGGRLMFDRAEETLVCVNCNYSGGDLPASLILTLVSQKPQEGKAGRKRGFNPKVGGVSV